MGLLTSTHHSLRVGKVVQGPFAVVSERWEKCPWLQVSLHAAAVRRQIFVKSPWLSESLKYSFRRRAEPPRHSESLEMVLAVAGVALWGDRASLAGLRLLLFLQGCRAGQSTSPSPVRGSGVVG